MLPSASKHSSPSGLPSAAVLMLLTIVSVGIGYTTSILVARWIGPQAFKDYAVTIASVSLLSTLAEAGVGKFALKYIPECQSQKAWPLLAGFLRFAILLIFSASLFLGAIVVFGETIVDNKFGNYPLGIGILFLPFLAFAGTGVDFVMANRAPIVGAFIARIVIPCVTLALLTYLQQNVKLSVVWAVACYGGGSAIGTAFCLVAFIRTSPPEIFTSTPVYQIKDWLRECAFFLMVAFMLTWIFRISIVVIKFLPIPENEVGLFAAALETGSLVLLLSKSTDKLFQPEMSLILEQHDWSSGEKLRRRRHLIIGSGCLAFLLIVVFFGKQILSLYGPEFVAGYPALCFISVGTCLWTTFSLAPLYLRYVGRDDIVIRITFMSALSMALLTAILGGRYGCTGGGIAFCIVVSVTAIAFFLCASFDFITKKHLDNQATM